MIQSTAANAANSANLRWLFIASYCISLMECYYLKFRTQPDVSLPALPHVCSTHVIGSRPANEPLLSTGQVTSSHMAAIVQLRIHYKASKSRKKKPRFKKCVFKAARLLLITRAKCSQVMGSSGPSNRLPRQGRAKAANKLNACLDWRDRIRSAPLIVSGSRCKFSLEAECASESRRLVRMR